MMRGPLLGEFTGTFMMMLLGDGVVAACVLKRTKAEGAGWMVITTGYAINPARDPGPRLAHALLPISGKGGSDWANSWIPIVGPAIGASLAGYVLRVLGA